MDEGIALITDSLARLPLGPYQVQAAIAALHAEAPTAAETDWAQIVALYQVLEAIAPNPMASLGQAVAHAMLHGPEADLARLALLDDDERLIANHRLHAVRVHLLELLGDDEIAGSVYLTAAELTNSDTERVYLTDAPRGCQRKREAGQGASSGPQAPRIRSIAEATSKGRDPFGVDEVPYSVCRWRRTLKRDTVGLSHTVRHTIRPLAISGRGVTSEGRQTRPRLRRSALGRSGCQTREGWYPSRLTGRRSLHWPPRPAPWYWVSPPSPQCDLRTGRHASPRPRCKNNDDPSWPPPASRIRCRRSCSSRETG